MKEFPCLILIVILGLLVYANALKNDFVYDDNGLVVDNRYIKDLTYLPKIFTTDMLSGSKGQSNFYRPPQILSYLIDYHLFKLKPYGYHLTNVLLHLLNGILIFLLVNKISKSLTLSTISGLLFTIHPIQTEAVTYISGRADPLACLFMLLSLLLFIKYNETKRIPLYLGSLLSFILALLSKEIAIVFPFLLMVYSCYFFDKKDKTKVLYLGFFLVLFLYITLRLTIFDFPVEETAILKNISLYSRLLTDIKVLFIYFKLLFLPLGLHMERTIEVSNSFLEPEVLPSVLGFAFLLVLIVRLRNKSKIFSFGLSWFFINLIPVSNILPLNAFLAEHWLYVPSIGLFMATGVAIEWLVNRKQLLFRKITFLALALTIIFYSSLTIMRNRDWRDELTFISKTLEYVPHNYRMHFNLGLFYLKKKLPQKAMEEFKKTLRRKPEHIKARYILAKIYSENGDFVKAKEEFDTILKLKPNNVNVSIDIHTELGNVYSMMSNYNEAIKNYEIVIGLEPTHPLANFGLANIYLEKGDVDDAIRYYQQAVKRNSDFAEPYNNLGLIYLEKGLFDEAIFNLKRAVKIQPNRAEFHMNLGTAYSEKNLFKEAKTEWQKALELDQSLDILKENIKKLEEMGY